MQSSSAANTCPHARERERIDELRRQAQASEANQAGEAAALEAVHAAAHALLAQLPRCEESRTFGSDLGWEMMSALRSDELRARREVLRTLQRVEDGMRAWGGSVASRRAEEAGRRSEGAVREAQLKEAMLKEAAMRDEEMREAEMKDAEVREAEMREAKVREAEEVETRETDRGGAAKEGTQLYGNGLNEGEQVDGGKGASPEAAGSLVKQHTGQNLVGRQTAKEGHIASTSTKKRRHKKSEKRSPPSAPEAALPLVASSSGGVEGEARGRDEERAHEAFRRHDPEGRGIVPVGVLPVLLTELELVIPPLQLEQYTAMLLHKLRLGPSGALDWSQFYFFYRKCYASEHTRKEYASRLLLQAARASEVRVRALELFQKFTEDSSGSIGFHQLQASFHAICMLDLRE